MSRTNYDGCTSYVDFRMREWGMDEQPRRIQTIVRRVLNEMEPAALVFLKDPRFEVMVLPGEQFAVGPYFTIHRRRCIVKEATALGLPPKDETRVLLVLGARSFEKEPVERLADYLRDGLGHVLLYLHEPKAWNDCGAAMKEWRRCVLKPVVARRPVRSRQAAKRPGEKTRWKQHGAPSPAAKSGS